jgi:hypothetical protein
MHQQNTESIQALQDSGSSAGPQVNEPALDGSEPTSHRLRKP